jgi:hypothetical protein
MTSKEELALLVKELPSLYLDRADDAWYFAEAVISSDWLAAHDAATRTATLEEAADEYPGSSSHPTVEWLRDRAAKVEPQ